MVWNGTPPCLHAVHAHIDHLGQTAGMKASSCQGTWTDMESTSGMMAREFPILNFGHLILVNVDEERLT